MKCVVVVSPHPDDETLGCGGTLLKHRQEGDVVHWVIMTEMKEELGYSKSDLVTRKKEIEKVTNLYEFKTVTNFEFPTTQMDRHPLSEIIGKLNGTFSKLKPEILYVPFGSDVHTDHQITFQAISSATKSFRHPYIKRILSYEVLSETEFNLDPSNSSFKPTVFIDIMNTLEKKLKIMDLYRSEIDFSPFPRSREAIRALAIFRGSTAGVQYAESFILLKEIL